MQRTPIFPNAALFVLALSCFMSTACGEEPVPGDEILGQGDFRYRVVKNWGDGALKGITIGNGHGLAFDAAGRLFFLNDNPKNNVLILSTDGKLLDQWTGNMPGAHGLTLVRENDAEVLFITDTAKHEVRKFSLDGKELLKIGWPESTKLYAKADEFRPSKTVWLGGEFLVFDGYGKDFIFHHKADGSLLRVWGGNIGEGEAQLKHWGPHGGTLDTRVPERPLLMIGMSDQQYIKRFKSDGTYVDTIPMPGGNPRDGVLFGAYLFVPHLGDKWPQDRNSRGFISVLDTEYKIVSNIGAPAAVYTDGILQPMKTNSQVFIHPHGVALDKAGNLYVAQFASPSMPILKLERVK